MLPNGFLMLGLSVIETSRAQIMFDALDALLEGLEQSRIWCVERRAMTEDLTE